MLQEVWEWGREGVREKGNNSTVKREVTRRIKCHTHSRSSDGPRWWLITADDQKTSAELCPPAARDPEDALTAARGGPRLSTGNLGVLAHVVKAHWHWPAARLPDRAWPSNAFGPSLLLPLVVGSERQRMGGTWGLGNSDSVLCWHWLNYSRNAEQRNAFVTACQLTRNVTEDNEEMWKHSYNEGLPSAGWATPN